VYPGLSFLFGAETLELQIFHLSSVKEEKYYSPELHLKSDIVGFHGLLQQLSMENTSAFMGVKMFPLY